MAAYLAGEQGAFAALFLRLAPRVHAFFMRSFRDRGVADDLLQTTFLKIHQARATFRPTDPLGPWVFTIAARVRIDELRRRYRLPPGAAAGDLEGWEERRPPGFCHRSARRRGAC